jgi:Tol biopolymer transport system component/DNA-binding winged helix-turn-helix (wHTH) protein
MQPLIYRFDGISVDVSAMRLLMNEEEVALEPKSFRLLQLLIENRERVLGKEEIFHVVWEDTAVTDNALTRAVAQIRKALEDDPKNPRYIVTVPTVGYRFIGVLAGTEPSPPPRKLSGIFVWAAIGAAVVLAAGFAAWRSRPKPPEPAMSAPIPLTSYLGSEDAPSFSPDGNLVAFQWNGEKEDNWDIYVKGLGPDSTPLRLTVDRKPDQSPAWSPDGRTIAFIHTDSLEKFSLMLIPPLGGAERKLAEFAYQRQTEGMTPAWSADSKWVVVPGLVGNRVSLFRVSVESGESSPITDPGSTLTDRWPAIAPDGRTVLFTRTPAFSAGDLYEVPIDESARPVAAPRRVPGGTLRYGGPKWMADGKEIVAIAQTGGAYRLPAGGTGTPEKLAWIGSDVGAIELSRRGNRMAYAVMHGDFHLRGDTNIWRLDLKAAGARPEKLIASTFRDVYPQYSRDGNRIAFYSRRSGSQQTWIANADGSQARQITFVKTGTAGSPNWSPDGKRLALDSNTTAIYQVYTVSADGGNMIPLTQGPAMNFGANWSRDGRWLYFCSNRTGRNEVWKMPAGGGTATQVTRNGGVKAVESEDGKTLFYNKDSGTGSIWKVPMGGGAEKQLTTSLYRLNFAVTKLGIYFMTPARDDGTAELKFYNFASRKTTTIAPMGRPEFGLDVSPDGRYLAYAQLDDAASVLTLVENFH